MFRLRVSARPVRGRAVVVAIALTLVSTVTATALAQAPLTPQPAHLLPGDAGSFPAVGDQTEPFLARGDDGFLAVWTDDRSTAIETDTSPFAAGTGQDVYAARLAADGSLIDTVPIVVTRAPGDQYEPIAVWNGTDWLVVWTGTFPAEPFDRHNTEAIRVSAAGEVLDAEPFEIWPSGGGDEHVAGAASDGQDWVVVMTDVYIDGLATKTRLQAMKITADGTVDSPHNVYAPACCSFFHRTGMAYADGVYMLVFEGYVDSWNYAIFGLRLNQNLNTLDSLPVPLVQTSWADDMYYRTPDVGSDGSNFYVTWQLWIDDTSSQVYGAVVTPDGVSANGDGVAISDPLPLDLYLQPSVTWKDDQWVVGWPEADDLHLARVNTLGGVLDPGGAATGLPGETALAGAAGDLYLAWAASLHAGLQPFDVVTASADGDLNIGPESVISLGAPMQLAADVAPGDPGYLAVYASRTADQTRILAQPLDDLGEAATPAAVELATGDVGHPRVAWDGQRYLVVWEEAPATRGLRVATDGTILDTEPLAIMDGLAPDVAGRDGDGFFVVATDAEGARAVRVAGDGTIVDAPPLPLDSGPASRIAAATNATLWLAAWEQPGPPDGGDVVIAGVLADGSVTSVLPVTTAGDGVVARRPAIAAGDSTLVAWEDDRAGDLDLYGRRISSAFTFADPPAGVGLITAEGDQFAPAVAWDGVRFVLDFADTRERTLSTEDGLAVYRSWAPAHGPVGETTGLPVFAGDVTAASAAIAGTSGNQVYAASVFHPEAPFTAYRIEVRFAGTPTAVGDTPVATRLLAPYPNPANPAVTLRFTLARAGEAAIDIFDVRGSRVRTLRAQQLGAGQHEMLWNGTDANGQPVPSGSYLFRLRADGTSATGKVTLVR